MPTLTKQRRQADPHWFADAEEVPRPGAPDARKLAKIQRRYRRLAWSCLILTPVAMLALVVEVTKTPSAPSSTPAATSSGAASSPGKIAATVAIQRWFHATPDPLPGGRLVSWDGASELPPPPKPSLGSAAPPVTFRTEIDNFTVEDGQGRPYAASVEVALTPSGAAALAGPSLGPAASGPAAESVTGGPWPGFTPTSSASTEVAQAVQGWASAYTSGGGSRLAMTVGDPNNADHYRPLSGVSSVTATITASAPIGGPKADAIIVETQLDLTWASSTHANGDKYPQGPRTTLDLLVERAATAAPVVVAWGPPGTGPALIPYQNGK